MPCANCEHDFTDVAGPHYPSAITGLCLSCAASLHDADHWVECFPVHGEDDCLPVRVRLTDGREFSIELDRGDVETLRAAEEVETVYLPAFIPADDAEEGDPGYWTQGAVEYRLEKTLFEAITDAVAGVVGMAGEESNVRPDLENDEALILTEKGGKRVRLVVGYTIIREEVA